MCLILILCSAGAACDPAFFSRCVVLWRVVTCPSATPHIVVIRVVTILPSVSSAGVDAALTDADVEVDMPVPSCQLNFVFVWCSSPFGSFSF